MVVAGLVLVVAVLVLCSRGVRQTPRRHRLNSLCHKNLLLVGRVSRALAGDATCQRRAACTVVVLRGGMRGGSRIRVAGPVGDVASVGTGRVRVLLRRTEECAYRQRRAAL